MVHVNSDVNDDVSTTKRALRTRLQAARSSLSPSTRERADALLCAHAVTLAAGQRIAAYAPLPSEPGGPGWLSALAGAAEELWLPISGADGQLTWACYDGDAPLEPGALGIAEPSGPRRGSEILAELDLILVPALAVDRRGIRLGKGAGFYDRALTHAESVRTVAVVFADEVLDLVPGLPHDVPVDAALTPAGVEPLGGIPGH